MMMMTNGDDDDGDDDDEWQQNIFYKQVFSNHRITCFSSNID